MKMGDTEKPKEKNSPWIEKYRPKLFNEIVGNEGRQQNSKLFEFS